MALRLKQVITHADIVPPPESVNIPFVQQFPDSAGGRQPDEIMESAAGAMLDEPGRRTAARYRLRATAVQVSDWPRAAEP